MSLEQQLVTPQQAPAPQTDDRSYRRLGWIVLGAFVGVFGIWGTFAPLSSAVSAPGKVIVASNNRIIQHLEGGIVKTIFVHDGDRVQPDQKLIELDATQARAQLEMADAQYYETLALESRLIAERDGAAGVSFPEELSLMANHVTKNTIVEGQRREFIVRRNQLADEKNVLTQRSEQARNQIQGLEAIVQSKSELAKSYDEEIKEWEVLYQQQLIDKMRLRDIKREKVRTFGDIANAKADIARLRAQISENSAQIIAQQQTFNKDVAAELREMQTKLADLRARRGALQDTLKRTMIVSPVKGTVSNLAIHTIGGVIPPGQAIMEIVPQGEPLVIDGKIAANEVNYVHVGLKAEVRFSNFAHIKSLNIVEGQVVYVAPDVRIDEVTKAPYYTVKIQITPEGEEELRKNHLTIQAGMPTDTMIIAASRTLSDYLIQPLKNISVKAFNEQ